MREKKTRVAFPLYFISFTIALPNFIKYKGTLFVLPTLCKVKSFLYVKAIDHEFKLPVTHSFVWWS